MMIQYTLLKRNKRLHIIEVESDKSVYTPPDFLRNKIRDRTELQKVVDIFNEVGNYSIKAIMEFEGTFSDRK